MADKKDDKPKDHFVEVMFVLLCFGIIILLWTEILKGFFNSFSDLWAAIVAFILTYLWPLIIILGIIIGILCIIGIIYNYRKIMEIVEEEKKIYGPFPEEATMTPVVNKNGKWERVLKHLNSPNAGDWRIAIIEADVMLDELLRAQGYHGDSVGDMLKGVEISDFTTLDNAWEAHKVRNQVAHAGGDYLLNEREVKRVISLYESVFQEFKII